MNAFNKPIKLLVSNQTQDIFQTMIDTYSFNFIPEFMLTVEPISGENSNYMIKCLFEEMYGNNTISKVQSELYIPTIQLTNKIYDNMYEYHYGTDEKLTPQYKKKYYVYFNSYNEYCDHDNGKIIELIHNICYYNGSTYIYMAFSCMRLLLSYEYKKSTIQYCSEKYSVISSYI